MTSLKKHYLVYLVQYNEFMWFKVKKNNKIIFHILYITVAALCSAFLKCIDFYKAHHSEKRGVL